MRTMQLQTTYRWPGPASRHGSARCIPTCWVAWRSADRTRSGRGRHHLHSHGLGLPLPGAIMDWYSRYVVAWSLSNTLDAGFCVEALEQALSKGKPEVFSTDQGGEAFIGLLERHQVSIGMDGRQGALHRQHLCRVGVAHGEVRRGVPESLLQRAGGQGRARRLLSLLHPKAPSGLGLSDTCRGVQPGRAAVTAVR